MQQRTVEQRINEERQRMTMEEILLVVNDVSEIEFISLASRELETGVRIDRAGVIQILLFTLPGGTHVSTVHVAVDRDADTYFYDLAPSIMEAIYLSFVREANFNRHSDLLSGEAGSVVINVLTARHRQQRNFLSYTFDSVAVENGHYMIDDEYGIRVFLTPHSFLAPSRDEFIEIPEIVYNTYGSENGYMDTHMRVTGRVEGFASHEAEDGMMSIFYISNDEGDVMFTYPTGLFMSEEALREIMPAEGTYIEVYFFYLGYSRVFEKAHGFIIGYREL